MGCLPRVREIVEKKNEDKGKKNDEEEEEESWREKRGKYRAHGFKSWRAIKVREIYLLSLFLSIVVDWI